MQKAAVEALRGPQQCIGEMRADYIKLRDKVVNGLRAISGIRCTKPEGAFYAYPNVSAFFGRGGLKAVVKDKQTQQRLMLPIAISYDHRVIDGGAAARFTVDLVKALEGFSEEEVKLG